MPSSAQRPSPTRADRRSIAYLTIAFIALSAIFHFTLGDLGAHGFARFALEKDARPEIVSLSRIETPTPSPPTPPPTPATPIPRAHQRPVANDNHKTKSPKRARRGPIVAPPKTAGNARSCLTEPVSPETSLPGAVGETPGPSTPSPQPSPTVIAAPDMIVAASFVRRAVPSYPAIAITGHWEGTVVVLLTLGPDGVIEARIGTSSGYPVLDRAALQAAKESTYRTPEINGKPAIETYRVIYTFTLSDTYGE